MRGRQQVIFNFTLVDFSGIYEPTDNTRAERAFVARTLIDRYDMYYHSISPSGYYGIKFVWREVQMKYSQPDASIGDT